MTSLLASPASCCRNAAACRASCCTRAASWSDWVARYVRYESIAVAIAGAGAAAAGAAGAAGPFATAVARVTPPTMPIANAVTISKRDQVAIRARSAPGMGARSEERRVGKDGCVEWTPHY